MAFKVIKKSTLASVISFNGFELQKNVVFRSLAEDSTNPSLFYKCCILLQLCITFWDTPKKEIEKAEQIRKQYLRL